MKRSEPVKRNDRFSEGVSVMTLGEGIAWLTQEPWGCACVGGSWCCYRQTEQAQRLQRAAHIVARLIADAGSEVALPVIREEENRTDG